MTVFIIEKLARHHPVDDFDYGEETLNSFLSRFAFPNQQASASQTYVGMAYICIIDFYTLVVSEVSYKDAMRRTLQAADIGGIRALAAHAKNDVARDFYEHFGFIPSPTDPLHLFILIKDLRGVK